MKDNVLQLPWAFTNGSRADEQILGLEEWVSGFMFTVM